MTSHPQFFYDYAGGQIMGGRASQQDYYAVIPPDEFGGDKEMLMVLADGMGGYSGGEIASKTATLAFLQSFWEYEQVDLPCERLDISLMLANMAIMSEKQVQGITDDMGTTFVAAWLRPEGLYWGSVGDSLLLLEREGQLTHLNAIHSFASELERMVQRGEITREEAELHPKRAMLTSALCGDSVITEKDIRETPFVLQVGDRLILASDGLLRIQDSLPLLLQRIGRRSNSREIVDTLLAEITKINHPRQDNVTIVIIRVIG